MKSLIPQLCWGEFGFTNEVQIAVGRGIVMLALKLDSKKSREQLRKEKYHISKNG